MFSNVQYLKNGKLKIAKFQLGDCVLHEEIPGTITGVVIHPDTEYIFAYTMFPTHRGSTIPEDEIEFHDLEEKLRDYNHNEFKKSLDHKYE